jgi:hypothetical protein
MFTMFTVFTMFIYTSVIMIKIFTKLLIISGLILAFNACRTKKSTDTKVTKEYEEEKRAEEHEDFYNEHH